MRNTHSSIQQHAPNGQGAGQSSAVSSAVADFEGERWRALETVQGQRFRSFQTALARGCYSEIVQAGRAAEYKEDFGWFIRGFFGSYLDGERAARSLEQLWVHTARIPSAWELACHDLQDDPVDWLSVSTGPPGSARSLQTSVRDAGRQVQAEVLGGTVAAILNDTVQAIVEVSGCSAGWGRDRLRLDLHRTCRLAGAELGLGLSEDDRGNFAALSMWPDGRLPLWKVGRKSLPFI